MLRTDKTLVCQHHYEEQMHQSISTVNHSYE